MNALENGMIPSQVGQRREAQDNYHMPPNSKPFKTSELLILEFHVIFLDHG